MKYKAVLFDMDGTILDTLEDIAASANAALEMNGLPARSLDDIRRFVGNGIRALIERAVPQGTDAARIDAVFSDFKAHYARHCADSTRPYDGITGCLQRLKDAGVKTAVISNKADPAVQRLSELYFGGLFDAASGMKDGVQGKPAPDAAAAILSEFGCAPEEACCVGDSDIDIRMAKNVGADCICVSWGFRSPAFLRENGAERIASDALELEAMLFQS